MSKSTINKLTISHKFSKTKTSQVISRGLTVFTDMSAASLVFTAPTVPMVTFKQDLDNLTTAAAAAADGSKKDIALRNKYRDVFEQDLTVLGAYAVKVANGDAAVLASSGFVAAPPRQRSEPQPLITPFVISVEQGVSGQFVVKITPVAKAHSYDVRNAVLMNGIPGPWNIVTVTAARKPLTIDGFTPGTIYAFQVRALGKLGYTDWSNSATRMSI